ncbi:MAG: hypothetical protein KDA25_02515 [Phycisphaerales bacterium]|nr:hypothetical protein [Phycisphaerales bacterium]
MRYLQYALAAAGLAGSAIVVGQMQQDTINSAKSRHASVDTTEVPNMIAGSIIGPDVIVGSLNGINRYTTNGVITSYSIGTTSCNVGDEQLDWYDNSPFHPVIAQSIYRLKDGRFQQLGQSWLKHGFCALQQSLCAACQPAGNCCCSELGVGCSDPYTASLNGNQGGLGPKYEVNPTTGVFPWPYANPPYSGGLARRIQVRNSDLNPANNPGALYFGEGQYVARDDASARNGNNNASWRKVTFSGSTYQPSWDGATMTAEPAIAAWAVYDPGVELSGVELADGYYILGTNVIDNEDGTWRYEYALYNMNHDRAVRSVTIPTGTGTTITDIGFSDVDYHSGEPYDLTDWAVATGSGSITWSTSTEADNANANALRWGTMYNFWFTANTPPRDDLALTAGFFKFGNGTEFNVVTRTPQDGAAVCVGDFDDDGTVGPADLAALLAAWGTAGGDLDDDGNTDPADLAILLAAWGPC